MASRFLNLYGAIGMHNDFKRDLALDVSDTRHLRIHRFAKDNPVQRGVFSNGGGDQQEEQDGPWHDSGTKLGTILARSIGTTGA